ncbi:hypothetical protein [Catenovulum maritimum]|uniref:IrrE N-terminal-like domain-containing protein n=1 Tax=Catenovulum maritimum TaxID=1513271 RepID=A0A0J8H0G4_9ALTE|nr:hypothetical protein [Catenovulum maritimum]KMT66959.1 hypothetical protein XM47_02355 [Catenovulum maritimum]
MYKIFMCSLFILFLSKAFAGEVKRGDDLSLEKFEYILSKSMSKLPKLWSVIDQITNQDVNIYITPIEKGLGKARGKNSIYIAPRAFIHDLKAYPEDRLIVVLLHEYGHILFNRQSNRKSNNKAEHEYAAFKYSVQHALRIAEKGDSGPIRQLVHYLPLRVQNGKKSDPHTIALKKLTKENFWSDVLSKYQ